MFAQDASEAAKLKELKSKKYFMSDKAVSLPFLLFLNKISYKHILQHPDVFYTATLSIMTMIYYCFFKSFVV